MVSISRFDGMVPGGIWGPFAAAAAPTSSFAAASSCSDVSGGYSRSLTRALSSCIIDDAETSMKREGSNPQMMRGLAPGTSRRTRLALDLATQLSQELPL